MDREASTRLTVRSELVDHGVVLLQGLGQSDVGADLRAGSGRTRRPLATGAVSSPRWRPQAAAQRPSADTPDQQRAAGWAG